MRNHPKILKTKFLPIYIILIRDTLLIDAFQEERQKDRKVKTQKKIASTKGPKKIWVPEVKIVSDASVS